MAADPELRARELSFQPRSADLVPVSSALLSPPAIGIRTRGSRRSSYAWDEIPRVSSRHRIGLEEELDAAHVKDATEKPSGIQYKSVEVRLTYAERQARRRATSSLLLGAISGGFGFIVAALLGIYRAYFAEFGDRNLLGDPFPSGRAYWPGSVSEMVNDPRTPTGKCWYAFETIAALAIWGSWYPWELRNVYVGGGVKFCWCCVPFLTVRTFVPPIGLLILVMISVSSPSRDDFSDSLASYLHLVGAGIMLGGHGIFEFYTLGFSHVVKMARTERILRWVFCIGCLLGGIGFLSVGQMQSHIWMCCADEWRKPTIADIEIARKNGHESVAIKDALERGSGFRDLYDTASGWYLKCKYIGFWSEVFSGFCMICGLLTIWCYCPERHLDLFEQLPGDYSEDEDSCASSAEDSVSP